MSRPLTALAVAAALLALGGCGKKPHSVDPPQGKDSDRFPHVYPAPDAGEPVRPAKPAGQDSNGPTGGLPPSAGAGENPDFPLSTIGGIRFP